MQKITVKQRRLAVRVAEDVLASIDVLKVKAGFGYIRADYSMEVTRIVHENTDSKEQAKQLKRECSVCALGACVLSLTEMRNKFDFKAFFSMADASMLRERLKEAFTFDQMVLIERAFECDSSLGLASSYVSLETEVDNFGERPEAKDVHKASADAETFGRKYDDSKKRLAAIMRNIIRNNGEFIPKPQRKR